MCFDTNTAGTDETGVARGRHTRLVVVFLVATWLCSQTARGQFPYESRTYDGRCNNLFHSEWGAAGGPFSRLASPRYTDQWNTPSGAERPNPRTISNAIGEQNRVTHDERGLSNMVWQWGQFVDHDIALTPTGSDQQPAFLPISVRQEADPLYPLIPFVRSAVVPGTGISGAPREQMNLNTAYLDGSMVYGSDASRAAALRTFDGGFLRTSAGDLLPRNTDLLENANEGPAADEELFLAGDVRANEQPGLTAMHTLFLREHNRQAAQLARENPTWGDEQLYQHARRRVSGIIQAITYNEFLPALLGESTPDLGSISYDPGVDATLFNEFATAGFRFGHSQVPVEVPRITSDGAMAPGGHLQLAETFFRPDLIDGEQIEYLLKGLASLPQQATDTRVVDPLRNALFGPPGSGGLDLFALNVQRGRDHGLPTFTEMQLELHVPVANDFDDVTLDPVLSEALANLYGDVSEIDLWVGLLAEDHEEGSAVGATLSRLLEVQFENLAAGDRFFFTNDAALSYEEVYEIANTGLSDVLRRNTSVIGLPDNVFFVPECLGPLAGMWPLVIGLAGRRKFRQGGYAIL